MPLTGVTTATSRQLENRDSSSEKAGSIAERRTLVPFLSISAQLALMFVLLRLFDVEPGSGLLRILPLVFIGFGVHSALPLRLRLPFFVLLSVTAIAMVVGPAAGAAIILSGLVLIGVAHLPIAFSARVVLLLLICTGLAAIRSGLLVVPASLFPAIGVARLPKLVLPLLGSMFMFRLIIYMYDLRHEENARATSTPARGSGGAPVTIWTRLGYFFLLPNVCFLVFPVIDYRTYRRTYYDTDAQAIYQKGVWWICLGLIQLLLYRLVYHYLIPVPEDVQGIGGLVRFMTSAYLIYLRVVGQFQLIMGLLCLFGFNLPPAHRFYLLASSFTDFWRRARIDWKDFMVKIFYYPSLVPIQRKLGAMPALVLATIWVFFVTWLLHSYQWFWMLGEFRLLGNDAVFWTVIGGCVLVNSVLEARKARAKTTSWSTRRAVVRATKTVGMIVFMCVLWSYWSSPSLAIWLSYLTVVRESGAVSYARLAAALAAVVAVGVLIQSIQWRFGGRRAVGAKPPAPLELRTQRKLGWRPAGVFAAAAVLLLIRVPGSREGSGGAFSAFAGTVRSNALNDVDQERQDRGYYEVLLDVPSSTVALAASTAALSDAAAESATDKVDGETSQTMEEQSAATSDSTSPRSATAAPSGPKAPSRSWKDWIKNLFR